MRKLRPRYAPERANVLEKKQCGSEPPPCFLACGMVQAGNFASLHHSLPVRTPILIQDWMDDVGKAGTQILSTESTQDMFIPHPCPPWLLFGLSPHTSPPPVSLQRDEWDPLALGPAVLCIYSSPCLWLGHGEEHWATSTQLYTTKEGAQRNNTFFPKLQQELSKSLTSSQGGPRFFDILGLAAFAHGFMSLGDLVSALTRHLLWEPASVKPSVYPTTGKVSRTCSLWMWKLVRSFIIW